MKALLLAGGFALVAAVPPLTVATAAGLVAALAAEVAFIVRSVRRGGVR